METRTFPGAKRLTAQKVTFKNQYNITLSADLYQPTVYKGKMVAIVGGPLGAVKEQGLISMRRKWRNADSSRWHSIRPLWGKQAGPAMLVSPDIYTEDFSAAVDFLGLQPSWIESNRHPRDLRLGSLALNAADMDKRMKAMATGKMYDMSGVSPMGTTTKSQRGERTNHPGATGSRMERSRKRQARYPSGTEQIKGGYGSNSALITRIIYRTPKREFTSRWPSLEWHAPTASNRDIHECTLSTISRDFTPAILFIAGDTAHSR